MHDGHRKRMRERFRQEGLEGFADHEALELLLFYGRARGDVNPLAHTLIDHFGSLQAVLEARPDQLTAVPGVGEETATLIAFIMSMFRRYNECLCRENTRIGTLSEMKRYCQALLSGWRTERLYAICMTGDHQLLGRRLIAEGTTGAVAAHPRKVVEAALNLNARAVILCHNHPGGSNWPSHEDVATTVHINALLDGMEIELLDHLIVAGSEVYSMSEHGDFLRGRQPCLVGDLVAADAGGQIMHKKRKRSDPAGKE